MLILKIAVLALISCTLALSLKKVEPSYAFLVSLCGALCLVAMAVQQITPVIDWLRTLSGYTQGQSIGCLLQVLGIAIVAQFAADLCREAGLNAAASSTELCGRLLAMLQALPLLQALISSFLSFLQ